jgi:hypothetical protein
VSPAAWQAQQSSQHSPLRAVRPHRGETTGDEVNLEAKRLQRKITAYVKRMWNAVQKEKPP